MHHGQMLVPWPEGSRYPGFIFARGRHRRLWKRRCAPPMPDSNFLTETGGLTYGALATHSSQFARHGAYPRLIHRPLQPLFQRSGALSERYAAAALLQ